MSHDQCPSTLKGEKHKPGKPALAATPRGLQRVNGQAAWRSAEDLLDTPAFREHLEREFPSGMAELVTRERMDLSATGGKSVESRREFLKFMGASMALAGAAAVIPGCRRPEHKIYPYAQNVPEEVIPGKPLFYVTSMARWDGGAEGLLIETHEGRPTKVEGNPLHPINQGKVSSWALASIMSLYDPDRPKFPMRKAAGGRELQSWDEFRGWAGGHFKQFDANGGEGLAFVVEKNGSPTRAMVRDKVLSKYPKAKWVAYCPSESVSGFEGTKAAFGKSMREVLNLQKAHTRVIVSLDHDFLQFEAGELPAARQFAATRLVEKPGDEMSRLYVVESGFSITGGQADHRLRLAPSRVTAFACALAKRVLGRLGSSGGSAVAAALADAPKGEDLNEHFLDECANDLLDAANRGKSVITAGPTQPAAVHAIAAALNSALENVGKSVAYMPVNDETASNSIAAIGALAKDIGAGKVTTLVCVNTNPAYDAPGDCKFAELMGGHGLTTITLSVTSSETADLSTWALNGSHYLESWGDTRALDGTVAPVQPMIAPLYELSMSEIEFLALLAGKDMNAKVDGYELLRECWQPLLAGSLSAGAGFDTLLRRCLHNGVVPGTAFQVETPAPDFAAIAKVFGGMKLAGAPTKDALEVVFTVGNVADGRFANVGWLQELPAAMTRVVWDNPVLLSPSTALSLGVAPVALTSTDTKSGTDGVNAMYDSPKYPQGRVVELKLNGQTVKAAVWVCPGLPENTAVLMLGYGRTSAGLVGDGVGFNYYGLRSSEASNGRAAAGLTLSATGDTHMIASTQNHWTIDSKTTILRAVDLPAWNAHGHDVQEVMNRFYGTKGEINFAEKLGELSHMPPSLSSRVNPFNGTNGDADPKAVTPGNPSGPKYQQNQPPAFTKGPQWAMTIDQTVCTGCGTCTVACQAENNIAVVGKKETAKGREMAWIRVDRYFSGDDFNNPSQVHHQPVACVHCENAPCEVVCPVNATVHGPEGINYMTYNRCIGTRYCANNCPYKVRRYNWFDYGVTKFNGGYYGKEVIDDIGGMVPGQEGITGSRTHNKINPNLIPPRLRQKLDEISRMQKNPDVTVRSRGVMEKCTYCVQRINAARIDAKLADLKDKDGNFVVPEGFMQTACQQACPSNAITFGDSLDPASRVHSTRRNARSYALLGYLNTRPRTSHMVRVMNPNPALLAKLDTERFQHIDDPFHHGSEGGEGGGGAEHGGVHSGGEQHSFFDKRRRGEDGGYAVSLRVLSASVGGMA